MKGHAIQADDGFNRQFHILAENCVNSVDINGPFVFGQTELSKLRRMTAWGSTSMRG